MCESWLLHLYKEAATRRGSYRRGTTRRDEAVVVTVAAHHNENIPNPDQDQDLPPSYEEVQMRNMNNVEWRIQEFWYIMCLLYTLTK